VPPAADSDFEFPIPTTVTYLMAKNVAEKESIANDLVGAAGVHYVASELCFRGLIALLTIKNTAGYDLIVASSDGKKHANIQVKTSQHHAKFWPMPRLERVCAGRDDYYVLVRRDSEPGFEAFMLTGDEAKKELITHRRAYEARCKRGQKGREFPCVWVERAGSEKKKSKWAKRWKNWNINQ
jgi:hypothetical protein